MLLEIFSVCSSVSFAVDNIIRLSAKLLWVTCFLTILREKSVRNIENQIFITKRTFAKNYIYIYIYNIILFDFNFIYVKKFYIIILYYIYIYNQNTTIFIYIKKYWTYFEKLKSIPVIPNCLIYRLCPP